MSGLSEFLAMGGYAEFVWPAYAVAAVVLVAVYCASRRALERAEAELAAIEAGADADAGAGS